MQKATAAAAIALLSCTDPTSSGQPPAEPLFGTHLLTLVGASAVPNPPSAGFHSGALEIRLDSSFIIWLTTRLASSCATAAWAGRASIGRDSVTFIADKAGSTAQHVCGAVAATPALSPITALTLGGATGDGTVRITISDSTLPLTFGVGGVLELNGNFDLWRKAGATLPAVQHHCPTGSRQNAYYVILRGKLQITRDGRYTRTTVYGGCVPERTEADSGRVSRRGSQLVFLPHSLFGPITQMRLPVIGVECRGNVIYGSSSCTTYTSDNSYYYLR
jgi:hypothetical protein